MPASSRARRSSPSPCRAICGRCSTSRRPDQRRAFPLGLAAPARRSPPAVLVEFGRRTPPAHCGRLGRPHRAGDRLPSGLHRRNRRRGRRAGPPARLSHLLPQPGRLCRCGRNGRAPARGIWGDVRGHDASATGVCRTGAPADGRRRDPLAGAVERARSRCPRQRVCQAVQPEWRRLPRGSAETLARTAQGWRVETADGPLEAEHVVLALGPWSPALLARYGLTFPWSASAATTGTMRARPSTCR